MKVLVCWLEICKRKTLLKFVSIGQRYANEKIEANNKKHLEMCFTLNKR